MNNRNYFFSAFTIVLLAFALMLAIDPQATVGLVVGFGKALIGLALFFLFLGFLVVLALFAPKAK